MAAAKNPYEAIKSMNKGCDNPIVNTRGKDLLRYVQQNNLPIANAEQMKPRELCRAIDAYLASGGAASSARPKSSSFPSTPKVVKAQPRVLREPLQSDRKKRSLEFAPQQQKTMYTDFGSSDSDSDSDTESLSASEQFEFAKPMIRVAKPAATVTSYTALSSSDSDSESLYDPRTLPVGASWKKAPEAPKSASAVKESLASMARSQGKMYRSDSPLAEEQYIHKACHGKARGDNALKKDVVEDLYTAWYKRHGAALGLAKADTMTEKCTQMKEWSLAVPKSVKLHKD